METPTAHIDEPYLLAPQELTPQDIRVLENILESIAQYALPNGKMFGALTVLKHPHGGVQLLGMRFERPAATDHNEVYPCWHQDKEYGGHCVFCWYCPTCGAHGCDSENRQLLGSTMIDIPFTTDVVVPPELYHSDTFELTDAEAWDV